LCSDLAIRSGTAARLGPGDYNPNERILHITTKYQSRQTIPVTEEIAAILDTCDQASPLCYVRQLWPAKRGGPPLKLSASNKQIASTLRIALAQHLVNLGITRRIIPHDLRRTAAVGMLDATHDVRAVQSLLGHHSLQSTIWYLDHDLRPISRSTLEQIKRPFLLSPPAPRRKRA
jgi:integrase